MLRSPNWEKNKVFWEEKGKIPLWEIAAVLEVHEKTLSSWLRFELKAEKLKAVLDALEQVKIREGDN